MKRLLLSLAFVLSLGLTAQAQCVGAGGVNTVPQVGIDCVMESVVPTYSATGVGIVPASATTDLACITGSATRIVRVKAVHISGSAGTLISVPVSLLKRAVADTGGTAATSTALPVPYPLDSGFPTVSATTIAYTANPTINDATPGIIDTGILALNLTTAAGSNGITPSYDFAVAAPVVLRGIAQQLCVNLNATSPSSGVVNVSFRWTEAVQ